MYSNHCKHFRGIQHKKCKAGIDWRKMTGDKEPGVAKRMPCISRNNSLVECDLFELPTEEEVKESNAWIDKKLEEIKLISPLISELKRKYSEAGGKGEIECPICKGVLHYSVSSYNGHVHGICETENCLRWME